MVEQESICISKFDFTISGYLLIKTLGDIETVSFQMLPNVAKGKTLKTADFFYQNIKSVVPCEKC
jgi:hypothetical protein